MQYCGNTKCMICKCRPTLDLRRKFYFYQKSHSETSKIGLYAKIQASSSIFVKLRFGPLTHVKLRSGPQYF